MAIEGRPGGAVGRAHLVKVFAGLQRHAMAHQNGLVALHMIHILFLANKLDCVAEVVISCPIAYMVVTDRCSITPHTCYMGVNDDLDLVIGFSHPTLSSGPLYH